MKREAKALRPAYKSPAASFMHRKPLTMDQIPLPDRQQFAITRRPRLSCFQRRASGFADRDHLPRVRFGELALADASAAAADPGEIVADMFLRFCHFLDSSAGAAAALQFNAFHHAS
jgi:hypothetical protein